MHPVDPSSLPIARLLRTVIALWIASAIGWAVWHWRAGRPGLAVVGALAIAGVHAAFLAVEFVSMHLCNRSDPAPRAGVQQVAHAWWAEVRIAMRVFCWQQAFFAERHADHLPADAQGRYGVVLIHGYACNRGFWNLWMPQLREAGIPHIAVNLAPPFRGIDTYVPIVDDAVRRMRDATGRAPLLVGHSMGGLVARAWLRQSAAESALHTGGLITIGTPHRGTRWAALALQRSARQMRPGSAWLQSLASANGNPGPDCTCYYSHCDNIVVPASTAVLPGSRVQHLAAAGHVDLMQRPEVLSDVLHRLAAVGQHQRRP